MICQSRHDPYFFGSGRADRPASLGWPGMVGVMPLYPHVATVNRLKSGRKMTHRPTAPFFTVATVNLARFWGSAPESKRNELFEFAGGLVPPQRTA